MVSNAHTHSTWCDGKNTLAEMTAAAIAKGFTDLGFTSHSSAFFDPGCPGVKDEGAYQEAVAQLARHYQDQIQISCGLEWDYYSPKPCKGYDYLIGSVHYFTPRQGVYRSVDESPETFQWTLTEWFQGDFLAMAQDYYDNVVAHIKENRPKIVGHFDLITKFNDRLHYLTQENEAAYQKIATQALTEVMEVLRPYQGLVEVNTGGISRGWTTVPYPATFLLEHLQQHQTPVIITSDSHEVATLDAYFEETQALLRQLGFREVWALVNGAFVAEAL